MGLTTIPNGTYNDTFLTLTANQAKALLPLIKQAHRRAEKMAGHYDDLICDGLGTERQSTAAMKWHDRADMFKGIIEDSDTVVGKK